MRIRRTLPLVLAVAVTVPLLVVLVVTTYGVAAHEQAMGKVMESYVLNVAQNVAAKINAIGVAPFRVNKAMLQMEKLNLFSWGPQLPGWVVVLDSNGEKVLSTSGVDQPSLEVTSSVLLLNKAMQVRDLSGNRYTVAIYPTGGLDNYYVVAAVGWDDLLGPMVRSNRLLTSLVIAVVIAMGAAVALLWRWVIGPLSRMSDDVVQLRWGDDIPCQEDEQAVYELRHLRRVLCRLSEAARDRLTLWKRYTSDMVRVQEEEKSRLSREIHDGPVQAVTALVQRIRLSEMDENHRLENLKIAEEIGSHTVRELRELCNHLTPPWLDLGLEQALNELAERQGRYQGVDIRIDVIDEKVNNDGVLTFFRILQEGVSNAVKHGKATEIDVTVDRPGGTLTRMTVEDNGAGFQVPDDLETLRASGHRGLLNMKERMQLVGGDMEIRSTPGRGTTILFNIPDTDSPDSLKGFSCEDDRRTPTS